MARMTFFDSYYEGIKNCDNATRLEALEAIIEYGLYGTEKEGLSSLAQMIFTLVKPSISKSREQAERSRENGGKGGRPRINDNPYITQNNQEKPKITQNKPRKTLKKEVEVEVEVEGEKEIGFFGKNPIEEKDANASQKESAAEEKISKTDLEEIVARWNHLPEVVPKIVKLKSGTKRYESLKARVDDYGIDNIMLAIEKVNKSDFLCSGHKWFNFEWFVLPNNFPKVLEGHYDNDGVKQQKPSRAISVIQEMIDKGLIPNDD